MAFDRVVALRRSLGDKHPHHLDGRELFAEGDRADLPDDLHPNAQGYRRMGERFVQRARGADAPTMALRIRRDGTLVA